MSWIHNDSAKGFGWLLRPFSHDFQEEPALSSKRGMGPGALLRSAENLLQ